MERSQTFRPSAYDALLRTANLAADDALVLALPDMEIAYQRAALSVLMARNQEEALASVVAGFEGYEPSLRELVLHHADALGAGVRRCMADGRFESRCAAIALNLSGLRRG